MQLSFVIGYRSGDLCVTEVGHLDFVAKAGLINAYTVTADSALIEHIRSTAALAASPLVFIGTRFYGLVTITPTDSIATAASTYTYPVAEKAPSNIAKAAIPLWHAVIQSARYQKAVQGRPPLQAWAIAVRYLKAAADRKGLVRVFNDEHDKVHTLNDVLNHRISLVKSRAEQQLRSLSRLGLIVRDKNQKWQWLRVESDARMFYVLAQIKSIPIAKDPKTRKPRVVGFKAALKAHEGTYNGEDLHYAVTPDSSILIDVDKKATKFDIEMTIGIPRGVVLKYLHIKKVEDAEHEQRVIKLLEAAVQTWAHNEFHAAVQASATKYLARPGTPNEMRLPFTEFQAAFSAATGVQDTRGAYDFWRAHRSKTVVAAATKQLRALAEIQAKNLDDREDEDAKPVTLPEHTVLVPRVLKEEGEEPVNYFVVLHPDEHHGLRVVLDENNKHQCADIEAAHETFDGGIEAAFELLVEEFQNLRTLKYENGRCVKSLGPVSTWPFAGSRIWMHNLNLKSTHPGLTFDTYRTPEGPHLCAIYTGVW